VSSPPGIFARLPCPPKAGRVWGSVSAILRLAEYQNRKFFFFLIEKIFARGLLNKCLENFSVLLRVSVAETLARAERRQIKSSFSVRILLVKSSNFFQ